MDSFQSTKLLGLVPFQWSAPSIPHKVATLSTPIQRKKFHHVLPSKRKEGRWGAILM